jgi:hypothetical protein
MPCLRRAVRVQIFYSTPRAREAGVLQLGDPIVGLMAVSDAEYQRLPPSPDQSCAAAAAGIASDREG